MKINGVDLLVRDTGGSGIPVYSSTAACSRTSCCLLGQALATKGKFRVISYERRGYGRKHAGALDMKGAAADASEVLGQLGIRQAHVFGHSTGGSIALELAVQSPHQVASLSLGEPDVPWRLVPSGAAIEDGFPQLAEMHEREPANEVLADVMSELHGPDYVDVFPADMLELGAADMSVFFESEYQAFLDWRLEPNAVKAFKMPVQFIRREHWPDGQRNGRSSPTLERQDHQGPDSRVDAYVPLDPSAGDGQRDLGLRLAPSPVSPIDPSAARN